MSRALARTGGATLGARIRRNADGSLTVAYEAKGAPSGCRDDAALVEDGLVVHVRAGENSGRTLRHDGVVRALVAEPLAESGRGEASLRPPAGVVDANASVVVWVESRPDPQSKGRPILAAVRAPLP